MRHLVRSRSELQRQVTELVEQRAAISEVLRAVANSPHDLQPIFDTILINATRLCRAKFGGLLLFEEKGFRTFGRRGPPNPVYAERWPLGLVHPVGPGDPLAQLTESGSPVHIADLAADQAYLRRNPRVVALVELAEVRTYLLVPLRKDDELATSRNNRMACQSRCAIQVQASHRRILTACSRLSTRPSPRAWAWAYLSAARSSKPTADGCGRSRANRRVLSFSLRSLPPERTGRDGVDVAVWLICDDSVGACPCRTGFHPRVKPEGMLRRDMRLGRSQGQ
jgi:hypothetical protein